MLRFITRTLILAWAIVLLGCMGVAWLHDSSGFLYVRGNTLVLYDVDEQEEREIVTQDWFGVTTHPAVSPNDRQVALMKVTEREDALDFQVFLYKLDGEFVKESPVLTVEIHQEDEEETNDFSSAFNYAEWSPDGKKVLLLISLPDAGCSGVYDVKQNEIRLIREAYPPFYFAGPCCSPDGRGFIGLRPNPDAEEEGEELVFVDWDGAIHKIDDDAFLNKETESGPPSDYKLYQTMRWEEEVLVIALEDGRTVRVNTEAFNMEATEDRLKLYEYAQEHRATNVLQFADGLVLQKKGDKIQVANLEEDSAETIFEGSNAGDDVWYFPSPDGRKVVVMTGSAPGGKLLLVGDDGELIAELDRE